VLNTRDATLVFVDPASGLRVYLDAVISPSTFRESLRPRSIGVIEQHEAPISPRALREEAGRSAQIGRSEVFFREVTPDLDDLLCGTARHDLRKKKVDVREQTAAVAVPIDAPCDFFEPGVHHHTRTTPAPIR
jgi:hypothetical protein